MFSTRDGTPWEPSYIVAIDGEKCIGCGRCYKVCSRDVMHLMGVNEDDELVACAAGRRRRGIRAQGDGARQSRQLHRLRLCSPRMPEGLPDACEGERAGRGVRGDPWTFRASRDHPDGRTGDLPDADGQQQRRMRRSSRNATLTATSSLVCLRWRRWRRGRSASVSGSVATILRPLSNAGFPICAALCPAWLRAGRRDGGRRDRDGARPFACPPLDTRRRQPLACRHDCASGDGTEPFVGRPRSARPLRVVAPACPPFCAAGRPQHQEYALEAIFLSYFVRGRRPRHVFDPGLLVVRRFRYSVSATRAALAGLLNRRRRLL